MFNFVVGDIHGMRESLEKLIDECFKHAAGRPYEFTFLGDYVDRGPDSKGVIEYLIHLSAVRKCTFLKGNHEQAMIKWLNTGYAHWLVPGWGGVRTLDSYGVGDPKTRGERLSSIPYAHLKFLENLKLYHEDEHQFFVHAGVIPAMPLEHQCRDPNIEEVFLWTREDFLCSDWRWEKLIVHGHTPTWHDPAFAMAQNGVVHLPNRLNIDTGAVFDYPTATLTAAVFTAGRRDPPDFLQVKLEAVKKVA